MTDRPLVSRRVMRVPPGKLAEPVVPTRTFSPAGVEEMFSPARPLAVRVRVAGGAHVRGGAVVAVVAERHVRRAQAHAGAVARVGRARVAVGAGAAERLGRARRRAAVPGELVAVIALLTDVEHAVAADVDLLAGDDEEGRLHATRGKERSLDLEEVRAAGASGDRVGRDRIADESC